MKNVLIRNKNTFSLNKAECTLLLDGIKYIRSDMAKNMNRYPVAMRVPNCLQNLYDIIVKCQDMRNFPVTPQNLYYLKYVITFIIYFESQENAESPKIARLQDLYMRVTDEMQRVKTKVQLRDKCYQGFLLYQNDHCTVRLMRVDVDTARIPPRFFQQENNDEDVQSLH